MILCSCNVITDSAVRETLASPNPPRTPSQVHRHLGCKAQCGRCVRSMRKLLDDAAESGQSCAESPAEKVA
jgi:bacterioferritin-associated ferredoxin